MENTENSNKNNLLPLIVVFLVILILVGGAYWFGKNNLQKNESEEEISTIREIEESGVSSKTDEITEEETEDGLVENGNIVNGDSDESVIETLKLLFAQKYEKRVEEITVNISEREGDYVVGSVSFEGEISGGYVLAAKVNEAWRIVLDGHGVYDCKALDDVSFPATLISECWDDTIMQTITR